MILLAVLAHADPVHSVVSVSSRRVKINVCVHVELFVLGKCLDSICRRRLGGLENVHRRLEPVKGIEGVLNRYVRKLEARLDERLVHRVDCLSDLANSLHAGLTNSHNIAQDALD